MNFITFANKHTSDHQLIELLDKQIESFSEQICDLRIRIADAENFLSTLDAKYKSLESQASAMRQRIEENHDTKIKTLSQHKEQILLYCFKKDWTDREQLSQALGIAFDQVRMHVVSLTEKGLLQYRGPVAENPALLVKTTNEGNSEAMKLLE